MLRKILAITLLLVFIAICLAGNHDPWDGSGWDITSPDIDQPLGNAYKEIYDLRTGVAVRIDKEHVDLASSDAGGNHVMGSARAWFQDTAPSATLDSTAFAAGDLGAIWFDSNATPDNKAYVLTATTPTWTALSASLSGETWTWTGNHTWDDGTTDSPTLTLTDQTNEDCAIVKLDNGDTTITIPADTDLEIVTGNLAVGNGSPGTAAMDGEDMYVEGAFEVDGVATLDGNVTIGGTLTVTGESTFNNHINLGAGDDLIGSATSDIAINTDKFTVAGATGNTVIAGTLTVAGGIMSAYTNEDSDTNTLLLTDPGGTAHAYLAATDGFVVAYDSELDSGETIVGWIDTDSNPTSGGFVVASMESGSTDATHTITFPVAKGEYFEVTSDSTNPSATGVMFWKSLTTLGKPVDQD